MATRCDYGSVVDIDTKGYAETDDCHVITGYGSIFNNTDLGNDAVVPGAFAKSLRDHGMPLLLFNHKMEDAPIGTIVDAKEDKRGLWFKAELPKDDSFVSGRIIPQLKRRGLKGTSIGYRATQKEVRKTDGVRLLKEIRLFEISVVNMPMNPLAGVETVKGLVPFQDLPVDRMAKAWDPAAALARIKSALGDNDDDIRRAFLFAEEGKSLDELDPRLLIADIGEDGELTANHIALYKCTASLCGARGGVKLPDEVMEAVKSNVDRYYQRLDLSSPFSSLSDGEFKALEQGEREARLRALGISRKLAADLSGLRDADRKSAQRDAGATKDADALLTAFATLMGAAAAIKQQPAG